MDNRFRNHFIAAVAGLAFLGLLLGGSIPLHAAEPAKGLRGYYTHAWDDDGSAYLTDPKDKTYKALIDPEAGQFIDGVSLDYDWPDIEIAPGTTNGTITCPPRPGNTENCFDFSYFTNQLDALDKINKQYHRSYKAIIGVVPSSFPNQPAWKTIGPALLPPWLFKEKGAQPFQTLTSGFVMINSCLPITVPVPWDPVFQAEYQKLINAFAAYVQNEPHRDLIAAVKLVGLVYLDENTHLPNARPSPSYNSCVNPRVGNQRYPVPDDIPHWKAAGYTPGRLLEAFARIVGFYKTAFPDMPLEMTTGGMSLVPIDEKGHLIQDSKGINVHVDETSAMPLIETARRIVGTSLNVSSHALANYHDDAGLLAYASLGYGHDDYRIGYGNGWLDSNDQNCIMTNGFRKGSPPECTGAWAMQENLTEAEIAGANFLILDLDDLVDPAYRTVLANEHRYFAADYARQLLPQAQQNLARSPWQPYNVRITAASGGVSPPVSIQGVAAPPLQYMQEEGTNSSHGVTAHFQLPPGKAYAFSVFAGLSGFNNRWVEVVANEGSRGESYGVFHINDRVKSSFPVQVGDGPGVAQMNGMPSRNSWTQLTIQFTSPAEAADNTISIRLIDPGHSKGSNAGTYAASYPGSDKNGMNFWGPQITPLP